jgi:subtilisin-like proprotein convertase family protein
VAAPSCVAAAVRVGAGYDDPAFGYTCGTGPVVPGAVLCFSNSSALIDFIAPGNDIDAAGLLGYSGTSMAAPHVAGLAAAYQARYGTDPLWTLERMRADAVPVPEAFVDQPYIHRYVRMGDHDAVLRFDTGAVLASDFDGLPIPDGDPAGLSVSTTVTCASEECVSGVVGAVYLDLNIEHTATGELAFELEAPDGTTARRELVDDAELGRYNVNSILGSQHLPDAFDALRGAPLEGTWTLRVIDDTAGTEDGALYRAALLIDSARVRLEGAIEGPRIARPGEPFSVALTFENTGNLEITEAPVEARLVRVDTGAEGA